MVKKKKKRKKKPITIPTFLDDVMKCFVWPTHQSSRYAAYYHKGHRKSANSHNWEAGTKLYLVFLLENYLKDELIIGIVADYFSVVWLINYLPIV